MEIDECVDAAFKEALGQSIALGVEVGAFGIYNAVRDRVIYVLRPDELPDGSIVKRTLHSVVFAEGLLDSVREFNVGKLTELELGPSKFRGVHGKIFQYHTHLPGIEFIPSGHDFSQIRRIASPLGVVIAGQALTWNRPPYVVAYAPEFAPESEGFSNLCMLNGDFGRKANELGIPVEDVTLLIYAQSMHGYVPSINIEIAK